VEGSGLGLVSALGGIETDCWKSQISAESAGVLNGTWNCIPCDQKSQDLSLELQCAEQLNVYNVVILIFLLRFVKFLNLSSKRYRWRYVTLQTITYAIPWLYPLLFAVVFGCDLANLFLNISESIFLMFTISVHICLYSTVSAYCDRKNFPYNIFSNLSFIVVIAVKITIFITNNIVIIIIIIILIFYSFLYH